MKLPSKTMCQLATLSRALTDPKADDFEAMDTHDMLMLVVEIADSHAKLEKEEFESCSKVWSINDIAIQAIEDVSNGASVDALKAHFSEILDVIHEE